MRLICPALLLAVAALYATAADAATRTTARLILSAETVRPGETVAAGVLLKMPRGWHTYWRNSGDSGAPTKITWELPDGIQAGDIQWPVPEKFTMAGLTTYVYHDEVLLIVPLTVAGDVPSGGHDLKAKVSWLECEQVCVPGKADVAAKLQVGTRSTPSAEIFLFEAWRKKLPRVAPAVEATVRWEKEADGDSRPLILDAAVGEAEDFLPYSAEGFEVLPATEKLSTDAGKIRLRKTVRKLDGDWPGTIHGIVVAKSGGARVGYEVMAAIAASHGEETKPLAASSTGGPEAGAPVRDDSYIAPTRSLFAMLVYAFLGGLILNIMPCVLPVIALKVLGFVNQSKESPRTVRVHGLLYGLGVLVSFLVLAGIVIAVQQAGKRASWGMQFQNPQFLLAMTVLVTLVALNLFGVFEITLGGRAMGAAAQLASKEGSAGAFFNGVLATALATPCTAPFLGVALGFAFTQSAPLVALMFLMIGVGLAAPYVLLSFVPGLAKFLPKPGAWMEKFKMAMGFPMLATAVWLLSLAAPHFGRSGMFWLGILLVLLAMAAWVYGQFLQRPGRRRGLAAAVVLALLALGYFPVLEGQLHWRSPTSEAASSAQFTHPDGIPWEPWSLAAVEKARAEGRPVLVDFTADWCVTCQANKKTSIEIPSVRAKLKEINAVALLGDYTREDDAITAELQRWGRAGVPLVLVYPADPKTKAIVLPEVLTPKIVLDALTAAAPKSGTDGSGSTASGARAESTIQWQPWSPEAVVAARNAGKVVIVDFTANWCPNCNWIEKFVLDSARVRSKLNETGAVTLRADWSNHDESIGRELERFGKFALPFILIYPRNPANRPMTFERLTLRRALRALDEADKG